MALDIDFSLRIPLLYSRGLRLERIFDLYPQVPGCALQLMIARRICTARDRAGDIGIVVACPSRADEHISVALRRSVSGFTVIFHVLLLASEDRLSGCEASWGLTGP